MTDITIKSLADEIRIPVERLIQQFLNAGICKSVHDIVSQQEKEILLSHLNHEHGQINSETLTLQRKIKSTLNILGSGGKSKSVRIEVRRKRTYVTNNTSTSSEKPQILIESQSSHIEKEKVHGVIKKHIYQEHSYKTPYKIEEKTKHEVAEKSKFRSVENRKSNHLFINKITKISPVHKVNPETKLAEINYKVKKEMRLKLEENVRKVAAGTRRLGKEKLVGWKNKVDNYEQNNYLNTTSTHIREVEDENEREVEQNVRGRVRNNKMLRSAKKSNKHSEAKTDREEARAAIRSGKVGKNRKLTSLHQGFNKPMQVINRDVIIGETITVSELSNKMAVKGSLVIKAMMKMGVMATINQVIDQKTAQMIAQEMGHKVILRGENELEKEVMVDRDTNAMQEFRAPVVTIMGHVDHGKTSLLDYIRSTKVAACEAGGITQHIGAYHVETENGMITFLDTPGHAAFTAMRARGAQVTDIVVLVVAADDGVMPQTVEAIQHAKAASVPIVVAVNKIDKAEADPNRVKNELSQQGVISEEWGGENIFVNISAKNGTGIDHILNAILLQAEMLELTAIRKAMATGVVIESFLDKGRGPIATVLVREGTLNKGDIVLCGFEYGRIRAMRNELGHDVIAAGPSIPVEILGLSGVVVAGDQITVVRDEKKAREVALYRQGKFREVKLLRQQKSTLENIFPNVNSNEVSELNIVLKADVQGSVEAITDSLLRLSNDEVRLKIIGSGVGGVTETDATLAAASNAIILGFNVRADTTARRIIDVENLDIRYYSVIYDLINEVKSAMSGMLAPEYIQQIIGLAEVRNVFRLPKLGSIAGCMVIKGTIKRHNPMRILRNNVVIYNGELESLRRFKDDVNEVRNGMECGIGVKNYNDVCSGDIIEFFELTEIKRTIN
ncbi:translation initiation factor IF-2 [Pantoea sp. Mhis]|uniref:translation initiation factor IF-2 n=1 Tax=Pantoea sp. Mhis TaxID=2576759 RepID=UPI001359E60B|nr:translation initiation factor IF-2 [Pantoea sp. Mhis]MXP56447.1 translation initiation factor IF-2 [Pantoea sp. Mhis]